MPSGRVAGYALSGERTPEAFYEGIRPFAVPFMKESPH